MSVNEPGLVATVDVQDEDEVLLLEIAADRRVVPTSPGEERAAIEIDDVTPPRVVRAAQLVVEGVIVETAQDGHRVMPVMAGQRGELIERETTEADAGPALARTL